MTPIIAIIGRTNVGKSSLFNVLTKTRNALVANYDGLTRDRQYGYFELDANKKIILVDTAGLDISLDAIEKKAQEQTIFAIKESHLIFFVVNARDGLMPQELEIIKIIRNNQKKTILIINKIDGIIENNKISEFYSLGIKEIQKISASNKIGITTLIKKYIIPWIKSKYTEEKKTLSNIINQSSIKVALIGRTNVGKSTLINHLLAEKRMITCNMPRTTLDNIFIPFKYKNNNYILIDTAGTCKTKKKIDILEKFSIIKTLKTIEQSNVILFIIDANKKIHNQDLSLVNFIMNSGKSIVIVINKWDLLDKFEKQIFKKIIKTQLKFISFFKIHYISALYKKGIFNLFSSIQESYKASNSMISTSKLTKIMYLAIKKHPPSIIKGRRIKLKYAHLGGSNPPKIIIHGNQVKYLSESYQKYLVNFFYHSLKIKGTPIQMKFKESFNPYIK